ncbi:hypothetical protein SAMN06295888_11092 [Desulfonatronum zhilinae]|nr:hypothetical protein SAMN06295888_11092 [Desulfonatronum zhilinae]
MNRIPTLVTRHPFISLILSLLFVAPFLAHLPHVQTVDNVDYFTLEDDPDVAFYDSIKATFGEDEFFVVAFTHPDLFTPPFLTLIVALTDQLGSIPEVREVQSLANVDFIHGEQDYFEVRPFLERIPEDPVELETLRRQALETPLYVGNLISEDGRTTAIAVFPQLSDTGDGSFRKRILEHTTVILEEHRDLVDEFHLAGWTVTNFSLSRYMKADVAVFIPVTYLFITLTIWLVFRNLRLTLLALANISVCTGATMGMFSVLGITLNNVTTIVPPLVMALALGDTVHIFSNLKTSVLRRSPDPARALESVLAKVIMPCFLTSLTTAVGFFSLSVSHVPPIKEFAYVAAAGMVFKFIFSFLLLPPLLLLCKPESIYFGQDRERRFGPALRRLVNAVQGYPRSISMIVALLVVGSVWAGSTIQVETNLLEYFKYSSPIRQSLDFVETRLSGVGTVDVSLKSRDTEAFLNPRNLVVIETIQHFAETLPHVDKTMSFVDFLKDMNKAFHDEDATFHVIPYSRELVAQYLLLYDSDDIDDFVTMEYDHARILIRISEHGSSGQAVFIDALRKFIDMMDRQDLEIRVTGRAVQDVNIIDALVWGQIHSLAIAAAVISLIMFLALRSVRIGALSLIPNIFPLVINFGIMGALGIPLNTSTALISVVALGIAVDDTIHFLTEYNRRRADRMSIPDALREATLEKGAALCATSMILVIGFGVLLFSNFVPTISFGGLSAVVMVTALVGDLVVLPAIMLAFHRGRAEDGMGVRV